MFSGKNLKLRGLFLTSRTAAGATSPSPPVLRAAWRRCRNYSLAVDGALPSPSYPAGVWNSLDHCVFNIFIYFLNKITQHTFISVFCVGIVFVFVRCARDYLMVHPARDARVATHTHGSTEASRRLRAGRQLLPLGVLCEYVCEYVCESHSDALCAHRQRWGIYLYTNLFACGGVRRCWWWFLF